MRKPTHKTTSTVSPQRKKDALNPTLAEATKEAHLRLAVQEEVAPLVARIMGIATDAKPARKKPNLDALAKRLTALNGPLFTCPYYPAVAVEVAADSQNVIDATVQQLQNALSPFLPSVWVKGWNAGSSSRIGAWPAPPSNWLDSEIARRIGLEQVHLLDQPIPNDELFAMSIQNTLINQIAMASLPQMNAKLITIKIDSVWVDLLPAPVNQVVTRAQALFTGGPVPIHIKKTMIEKLERKTVNMPMDNGSGTVKTRRPSAKLVSDENVADPGDVTATILAMLLAPPALLVLLANLDATLKDLKQNGASAADQILEPFPKDVTVEGIHLGLDYTQLGIELDKSGLRIRAAASVQYLNN